MIYLLQPEMPKTRNSFSRSHVGARRPSRPTDPRQSHMTQRKLVVLVIEDEPNIRMGAMDSIAAAGFEALGASNADEAIRILESRLDIHLAFTDVRMPGSMDGLKLAHYIRGRWPSVKLIVASGELIADGHLPPGAQFFHKPYSDGAIIEAMIGMLRGVTLFAA
jgi:two-component system, response regulator PdtaR